MEVCPKCGLPKEACVCETLEKSKQKIQVSTEKRKFKEMAVIGGIDSKAIDIRKIAKELKTEFACGGTIKNDKIELQGHKDKVQQKNFLKKIQEKLKKMGFSAEVIE